MNPFSVYCNFVCCLSSDKFATIQDNCDEGGDRPDSPHHPHPLHVLPLHELVPGQGGHLQRAHRQVLAHIHGDLDILEYIEILKSNFQKSTFCPGELLLVASRSGTQLLPCSSTL